MTIEIADGGCFLFKNPDLDDHLWVIISRPCADYERIAIVNLTSWRKGVDTSCIIEAGEHPWVKHRTCVRYRDAKVVSHRLLDAWGGAGHAESQEPFAPELLRHIRAGAAESVFTPYEVIDILDEQGLLPEEQQGL